MFFYRQSRLNPKLDRRYLGIQNPAQRRTGKYLMYYINIEITLSKTQVYLSYNTYFCTLLEIISEIKKVFIPLG